MPFDPLSAGVAGAGLIFDFIKNQQARKTAQEAQAFQREQLAQQKAALENALIEARSGQGAAMRAAGGLRLDQFGNATYYDPAQGRWITTYSPTQQRLIEAGQERQGRAQARGAQAAEDYDRLRAEYLYRRPKTEAESYDEIVRLINQATGQGERGLNTLMSRFGIRTAGNLPQLVQTDTGPSPGQQLAETMLRARGSALDESLKREAGHTSRYLPALKQFEETANYVAPLDPTGSTIVGMQQKGLEDWLKTGSTYDKLLADLAMSGQRNLVSQTGNVGQAYNTATYAGGGKGIAGDFLNLAKMLMPGKDAAKTAGTVGDTTGATYSGGGGTSGGGGASGGYDFGSEGAGPGLVGLRFPGGDIPGGGNIWRATAGSEGAPYYGVPYTGGASEPGYSYSMTGWQTPWRF
jgi:hypothetical protein